MYFSRVRLWEGSLPDTLNLIMKNVADSLSMVISLGSRESHTENCADTVFPTLIYRRSSEDLSVIHTPCVLSN